MDAIAQPKVSVIRKLVIPLFLVSGATGLVYEVVWMRSLGTVFGNTVLAASTILTSFMLGLALGGWLLGRLADRTPPAAAGLCVFLSWPSASMPLPFRRFSNRSIDSTCGSIEPTSRAF